MRFGIFLVTVFSLPFVLSAAETSPRTGFVERAIWFSEESLVLDQNVKIYTVVFNGEDSKLNIKVDFTDEDTLISTKELSLNPNETKTVFADWKVLIGDHNISAKITTAKINGDTLILENRETDSIKFSVTKEVPGNVVKNALFSKFDGLLKGEGDFFQKLDSWFKLNFKKSEEFREKTLKKINSSEEKVKNDREKEKNSKTSTKIISLIHLYALIIVGFIFSVSVIFYISAIIIAYLCLRIIWRTLKRIFRKKHEE